MAIDTGVTTYEKMQARLAELEKKLSEGGDMSKEDKLVQEALRLIQNVPVPSRSEMELKLGRAVELGQLDPIQAQQILADETMWKDFAAPPELKAQQYKVLDKLGQIADAGGLDMQAKARLEKIAMEEGQAERGAREAIMQKAAAQGRAGGGLDLAQRLISQQGAATRASSRGTEVAAEAEKRALEALMQQGQMAGQMRSQETDEQARLAQARQAIQQFNVANMLSQQESNIGRQMEAQKAALAEKQRVQELNLAAQQAEAARRAEIPTEQYGMQMQKAGTQADIKVGQASNWQAAQEAQAQRDAEAAQAKKDRKSQLVGGLIAAGGAILSDENAKEGAVPVNNADVDDFLAKITGYKYRYKGDDEQVGGVMAQDVARSEMGQGMVHDSPEGKVIDTNKMVGAMAASVANLNERLKMLEDKKRGN